MNKILYAVFAIVLACVFGVYQLHENGRLTEEVQLCELQLIEVLNNKNDFKTIQQWEEYSSVHEELCLKYFGKKLPGKIDTINHY